MGDRELKGWDICVGEQAQQDCPCAMIEAARGLLRRAMGEELADARREGWSSRRGPLELKQSLRQPEAKVVDQLVVVCDRAQ